MYNTQDSLTFKSRAAYLQGGKEKWVTWNPTCYMCGRSHSVVCYDGFTSCFNCGHNGHFIRECTMKRKRHNKEGNRYQSYLIFS